jgi:integrase
MPVYKRKTRRNKITWFYQFEGPGSTRANRVVIKHGGYRTKEEATNAEAARRLEAQKQAELERTTQDPLPKTLGALISEFLVRHAGQKLAPKTAERYREMAGYLAPELRALPLGEVTSLHLAREWERLLKSGGHTRKDKSPRPMTAKTVRNIAGLVSSAFSRGKRWGICTSNPVTDSEPPVPAKRRGIALVPSQQDLMRESASGPWCLPEFLELSAATGARRGEVLALRWTDLDGNRVLITRSLTQTKAGLQFKGTKTEKPRMVNAPSFDHGCS